MNRRDFLGSLAVLPLGLALPRLALAGPADAGDRPHPAAARRRGPRRGRHLILVELKGGNDGLNTVIPYADPAYAAARPHLRIPADQVVRLDSHLGLHPALAPLMPAWKAGDLGIVLGVGYPDPNRSHFRSIDIWNTGSGSHRYLDAGWVDHALAHRPQPTRRIAEGIVVGHGGLGPLAGGDIRSLVLARPRQLIRQGGRLAAPTSVSTNPALAHILQVEAELRHAADGLRTRLESAPPVPEAAFPHGPFGRDLHTLARLILAGVEAPAFKVSLPGFDTHVSQLPRQARLLKLLADGLAAFRAVLVQAGRWDRVAMLTYSEFGRRVAENASGGTDHGTAAPHLLLGGRVRGGFHGKQPSLTRLDANGDLVHGVDYRAVYDTLAQRFWGLEPGAATGRRYPALALVR